MGPYRATNSVKPIAMKYNSEAIHRPFLNMSLNCVLSLWIAHKIIHLYTFCMHASFVRDHPTKNAVALSATRLPSVYMIANCGILLASNDK